MAEQGTRPCRRPVAIRRRLAVRLFGALVAATVAAAVVLVAPGAAGAAPIGMVCTNGPTFNLTARAGDVETPDGNSIFMWSYSRSGGGAPFQTPGPTLCANEGDTVTVRLRNNLSEPVSVVFPGQEGVSASGGNAGLFTRAAQPGGIVTYTFVASKPGTYLYESGTNPSKQVEMGLYGALVVRPAGHPDWAYGDSRTAFDPDREYLQLFSEIDPDLHHAVETGKPYDITKLHNRYFQINGREFPDTIQDNNVSYLPHQPYGALVRVQPYDSSNPLPALVRIINAGLLNHPFHPHGNHTRVIAHDGRLILTAGGADASTEHFAETVPSGSTQDLLFKWTDQDSFSPQSPLPVTIPSYRNLTFKDGDTFYSGSPYLGYKGTLPATVTQQNVCGEFYFPWHSHALNEFANFDEGFGGMATLLRLDPLGGCFTAPTAATIQSGSLRSGSFAALAVDDAATYKVDSTTTDPRRTSWYGTFTKIPAGFENPKITYKGGNSQSCLQRISIWRWTTSSWINLNQQNVGPSEVSIPDLVPPGSPSSYRGTGSNAGRVRVRVFCQGPATNFFSSGNLLELVYDAP
jgi:FtsP/CotA-like multicopper oxidase with cupredoxin domain